MKVHGITRSPKNLQNTFLTFGKNCAIIKYEKMKEGIVMTKEKALKATKLLEEIETIDMLNEELANFLASKEFDALPQGLYAELFQVIERYLNEKQDELDEL